MVTFKWPYDFPWTFLLELRNPVLGDSYQLDTQVKFKQAMDGSIHSNKRTGATFKMLLNFETLTLAQVTGLVSFFNGTIGKEVRYEDHEDKIWRGFFESNSLQVTTIRDACAFNCTVDFIGGV